MKKRIVMFTAALSLLVVIAVPFAFAQRAGRHGMGPGHGGDMGVMMLGHLQKAKQALGLSDQQVSDIQAILTDLKTQNQPYRESMRGGMINVVQTLLNNPNDLATAQAQIDKQADAERALKTNTLNAVSKALNVLTADQRAKLQTIVQDRIARRQNQ